MNKLAQLRDENNGYNPEDATIKYKVLEFTDNHLTLEPKEGEKTVETWVRVYADSEEEFIILYPKVYSVIYRNKFYVHQNSF